MHPMMVRIGNFFFHYRNGLFPLAVVLVFLPTRRIVPQDSLALALGLLVIVLGQLSRAVTIGLAYIKRGGHQKQVYADGLVCDGLFAHCRNPLYVGNILMLLGFGIALNSLTCLAAGGAFFLFVYSAIVRAEENYLRGKFGEAYDRYCAAVPRWAIRPAGLGRTVRSMRFNWRRLLLKEYGTFFNWVAGLPVALYLRRHVLLQRDFAWTATDSLLLGVLVAAVAFYGITRHLKKSRVLVAD